jgi:nicotinate-nucleotide--dimethylbenzimidazole phosphoribosyltransferase
MDEGGRDSRDGRETVGADEAFLQVAEERARFSDDARAAVYDAIRLRRDVRHFDPNRAVDAATLRRVLEAAHHAPSVGFSQPWGFVLVADRTKRERIRESFLRCREAEAQRFSPERREAYHRHRLEGILEAAANVCVVVDLRPRDEAVLGTTAQPEAVRASACCAVQNLWLAARAEGLGVGWVSIVEPQVLRAELALPAGVEPIAYLCVGHPRAFRSRPMLEEKGWLPRKSLDDVLHPDGVFRDTGSSAPCDAPPPDRGAVGGPARATDAFVRPALGPLDEWAREASRAHQALLTKPAESLGRLETLANAYAAIRRTFPPKPVDRTALVIFAADHGVTVEGVSAYGSQLTAAMVVNVMAGGAAVNTLAERYGVVLRIVDVGVTGDLSAAPLEPLVPLVDAHVRRGTGNIRCDPAMSRDEAWRAFEVGARQAAALVAEGFDAVAVGELGIGNTTAAAALLAALTSASPGDVVGRGTGVSDDVLARKLRVIEDALARHRPRPDDPLGALSAVGGLELAAMAGFVCEAARSDVPVVLDGFLADVAALAAERLQPGTALRLIASHASAERGAKVALEALGLSPLLDLGLRLGEGTGAVLGLDLLRTAVALPRRMATFATAGIVGRSGADFPAREGR